MKYSTSLNTSESRNSLIEKFKPKSVSTITPASFTSPVSTTSFTSPAPSTPYSPYNSFTNSIKSKSKSPPSYLEDVLSKDFSLISKSISPDSDGINYTNDNEEEEKKEGEEEKKEGEEKDDKKTLEDTYSSTPSPTPEDSPPPSPTPSPNFDPIFPNKPITACICPYYMNETVINPFYEYLFTWNEETKYAEFPKKIINLQLSSSSNSDIEDITPSNSSFNSSSNTINSSISPPTSKSPHTSVKTQIMNEAIEFILDLFNLHDVFNQTLLDEMFKGFIWIYETHTIYIFFNIPNKKTTFSKSDETTPTPTPQYKWAILDEIINKQYIANKNAPVLPEIVKIFKENTFLKIIHINSVNNSSHKIPVEYPRCLYLCENQNAADAGEDTPITWKNIAVGDNQDKYYIENTVNYSVLGDFYYFSTDQIDPPAEYSPWKDDEVKRYAVFLNIYNGEYTLEESYIVKDTSTVTKEQWEHYFSKTEQSNVSTIWFKDKGLQLWAIKYPNQFYSLV